MKKIKKNPTERIIEREKAIAGRDYVQEGLNYADDVLSGVIPSCRWMKLACKRTLDDIKRTKTENVDFRFDRDAVQHVCRYMEMLPQVVPSGDSAWFNLFNFQSWELLNEYGFIMQKGERKNCRKFTKSYKEKARGNGKSATETGKVLYHLYMAGEQGAQVMVCATNEKQLAVFRDAQTLIKHELSSPRLVASGLKSFEDRITHQDTGSWMSWRTANSKGNDGDRLTYVVADELHEWQDRRLYDAVDYSLKRRSASMSIITTAGFDLGTICYELHERAERALISPQEDEQFFAAIWTVDDQDNWGDETEWKKANPALGYAGIPLSKMREDYKAAVANPAARHVFFTKRLNIWLKSSSGVFDMEAANRCKNKALSQVTPDEIFKGQRCYIGVDLSSTNDLTSKVMIFPRIIDNDLFITIYVKNYLPEKAIKQSANPKYPGWAMKIDGKPPLIETTPGSVVDYNKVFEDIKQDYRDYDVVGIGFDPSNATQITTQLLAEGLPVMMINQRITDLNAPTKELIRLISSGRMEYNNETLFWALSNSNGYYDTNGNIKVQKTDKDSPSKVDPVSALVNALAMALENEFNQIQVTSLFLS